MAPAAPQPLAKLVVPAGPGAPPLETAAHAIAIAEMIRKGVRERLLYASNAGGPGDQAERMLDAIEAIGAETVAAFEAELSADIAARPGHRHEIDTIECRRGCAFCCHVDVDVTPLEAIRLARRERAGARRAEIASAAARGGRRGPCPLLVAGACSQYEFRPFACRSLFSPDAAKCEAGFVGAASVLVPSLDWPRFLACGYITGEIAALDDLGLASHLVELRGSLALLLADDGALARWLNGEDVFPRRRA
jgi:hypothetical protein